MRIVLLLAAFTAAATFGFAQDSAKATQSGGTKTVEAAGETTSGTASDTQAKEVGNKRCPISGQPVGSMQKGSHIDYNGYRVGLCCESCKKAFMKKADANLKKAMADAAETTGTTMAKQEKSEDHTGHSHP